VEVLENACQNCGKFWETFYRKETSNKDRRFLFLCILFVIIIGGILVVFIQLTNEIFSPSNKIRGELGWGKDLSAPRYRSVDKSSARPGRTEATATQDFDVHISYL
jgi:hypothetical protein